MSIIRDIRQKLIQLNLFADVTTPSSGNEEMRREQVLATRVYLLLLVSILLVLVLFTCLRTQTVSVTVPKPSLDTYDKLVVVYSQTLSCPCQEIAVRYSNFITLNVTQHPVRVIHRASE